MSNIPLTPQPASPRPALPQPACDQPASPQPACDQPACDQPAPRHARGRSRRAQRALSWAFVLAGSLTLLDAGVTLVWQEPISALYASLEQDRLSGALRKVERAPPTAVERHRLALLPAERQRIAFLARELQRHAALGGPVGSIYIPRIGVDFVVVIGTGSSELEKGRGVFPETGFPGVPGTTAIAGHRTTYLAPFRHIDALRKGNRILLDMPYARFTYAVTGQRIVDPTDVGAAVNPVGYSRLVLSACTPLFSAARRILVFARLTRTVPVGAARLPLTSGARTPPARAARRPLAAPPLGGPVRLPQAPSPPT